MKKLLFLICIIWLTLNINAQQYGWQELGTGADALKANSGIQSICIDKHGNVYAAGGFTDSAGYPYVAKWDGINWTELGTDSNALHANSAINAICVDTLGNIYAAGDFVDTSNNHYVAKWNGTKWTELGTDSTSFKIYGLIATLCTDPAGNVYMAGGFTDSNITHYVAKWDGIRWSELGTGANALNANDPIWVICSDTAGNIYAGGSFAVPGILNYVAKWDGNTWSAVGITGFNNDIWSLCTDRYGNIYTGGWFTDSIYHNYVAKYDGQQWLELGTGTNRLIATGNSIYSICADMMGNIYAAVIDDTLDYVAKWNGTTWTNLGNNFKGGSIRSICLGIADTNVLAGGQFYDRDTQFYVAKYGILTNVGETIIESKPDVLVYPNPVSDAFIIQTSAALIGDSYLLLDLTGRTILSGTLNSENTKIIIDNLSAGIYLLKIGKQNTQSFKILKN